ncbi:hypothetical protein EV401DRAFT_2082317 [Pisolithus croceorrhizus]|nr:hypothetical protein EV401DRAFT_2082317 [Pisolithus croceorrhizus]
MSSAVYPIPDGPRNVLQMTHNILATENVTLTQLWATTPVPTTPPVFGLCDARSTATLWPFPSVCSRPQSPASEHSGIHEDAERRLDIPQRQSTATDDCPGGMGERTPGPTVSDMRPAAHTSRSHSIVMGDDAGGTSGSVQPAVDALPYLSADSPTNQWADRCSQLLDPINSGEGGTADCDLTVRQKKRKLM